MDDIKNKCSSESSNTDPERTDMKERAELSDTAERDEVTEHSDDERLRNEIAEEGDIEHLGMQLWNNHIIMREIMSHLDWRDQMRCELVCRLWRDAVKSAQRTSSLRSYDFAMVRDVVRNCYKYKLHVSNLRVQTRPMCAIGFYIKSRWYMCEHFSPAPCEPPCATVHTIIEAVHKGMLSKRTHLLAVHGVVQIYMPLRTSRTFPHTIHDMDQDNEPILTGLYMPMIPNVNYRTVHCRSERTAREDFCSVIDDICATDIIKGVVVFAQQTFLEFKNRIMGLLDYIKHKQPSSPYALGGCVAWPLLCKGSYIEEDMPVTMGVGVFSVPKEPEAVPGPPCQFNMHSLVIDSTVREKDAIQEVIQAFARSVPELQHGAALMLSNYERYKSDFIIEQELFRASFPRTALVGCYSDTVIGCNHPDVRPQPTEATDRLSDSEQDFIRDDSTVLVYFGWGKRRTSGEEARRSLQ